MPIDTECDICGKKYHFSDDYAGMTVTCKECTADFDILKPPLFDRRVLIGVVATVGAMVALFLIAVVIIELVNGSRGTTPVANSSPTDVNNRVTNPPGGLPPSTSNTPTLPRLPSSTIPNTPATQPPVSNSRRPPISVPLNGAPVINAIEPRELIGNGSVTLRGQGLTTAHLLQAYNILDPAMQVRGVRISGDDSQATLRLLPTTTNARAVAAPCILMVSGFQAATVTLPKRIVELADGQAPPAEYRTLLYVPANSVRRVGSGVHVVFVDSDAGVDLNGTSGLVILRPGARIVAAKDVTQLEILGEFFQHPADFPVGKVRLQLGHKVSFCVVDELPRLSN